MSLFTEFMLLQASLLAVVLVLHTYLGLHIIKRGIIFCDLVLDQMAALGMVVGVGLGIQYGTTISYLCALGAVLIGSWLLAVSGSKNPLVTREAVIGIIYAFAFIALLLLADRIPQGGTYITKTLVGSMMWASWQLVGITVAVYLVLLLFHYCYRDKFFDLIKCENQVSKKVYWDFMFFVTQGVVTILIVPLAGVLLAYGLLMIPAAIGIMFSTDFVRAGLIGWITGFLACVLGLIASFEFDWPYGPTLLLSMGACFVIAAVCRMLLNCRLQKVEG